ncbi:MAG: hypothetical protein U9O83_05010 [Campylobacterota bacterium]|nr:hypothetical protein [Campylobacterota bacterium]
MTMTLEEILLSIELTDIFSLEEFYGAALFYILGMGFVVIVYGSGKYKALNDLIDRIF